jgi:HlyD family secretion protein
MGQSRSFRIAGFAALLLGALATACGGAAEEAYERGGSPIPAVEVVQARRGALPLFQRLTGTVRASGEVGIFPQTSGAIVEVMAENGDQVKRGQPLVRIQAPGSEAQLAQARSNLAVARAEVAQAEANVRQLEAQFERTEELGEQGLLAVDTVETQRTQVQAARANLNRASAQVQVEEATIAEREEAQDRTVVRAPISGQLGQRNAEVGMRVDEQTPLFVIGRLEKVRVEVPVTQEILSDVAQGQRVEIGIQGRAEPIGANVSRISPFLEAGSYSAEVEIDVPNGNGRLVPGMFVTVDIFYGESRQATLVPTSALYEDPNTGQQGIFVAQDPPPGEGGELTVDPMPFTFRSIDIVAEGPQTVGVEGVQPDDWVVVVGQHLLAERQTDGPAQGRVRIAEWDRILHLQRLQRDDLLRDFMEKQRQLSSQVSAREGT